MNPYLPYSPGDAVWYCRSHVEQGVTVVDRYPATVVRIDGNMACLKLGTGRVCWAGYHEVKSREADHAAA